MKICLVASSYPRFPGDIAGVFVRSLAEALLDRGHDLHILAPYHPSVTPQRASRVPVTHFRFAPLARLHRMGYAEALVNDRDIRARSYLLLPLYLLCGSLALLRLCRESGFDLLNAHWVVPNAPLCVLSSLLTGVPIVTTLHGSDIYVARRSASASLAARLSFRRSAAVTACSDELRDGAISLGATPQSSYVIPWGVDKATFQAGNGGRWRKLLKVSRSQPVVIAAGRVVEKKGFEHLVLAAPSVLQQAPEAVFVVGGDGQQLPHLRALARSLGVESAFRFPGLIPWDQMPEFLSAGDLFVAPSVHDDSGNVDGMPTVVLEAMASGLPVVATRVAGLPLVVKEGQNGLLVKERDPKEISEALLVLLKDGDMRRRMASESLRMVEEELSWEATALRFEEIFEQAIGGPM